MKIKTTMECHFMPTRVAIKLKKKKRKVRVGEEMDKLESSHNTDKIVKCCSPFWKTFGSFSNC